MIKSKEYDSHTHYKCSVCDDIHKHDHNVGAVFGFKGVGYERCYVCITCYNKNPKIIDLKQKRDKAIKIIEGLK